MSSNNTLTAQLKKIKDDAEQAIAHAIQEAERKTKRLEERTKANAAAAQAAEECRARLEGDNGMVKHPKRDLLWAKAWDHGHSAGLSEVELWYEDLVELLL